MKKKIIIDLITSISLIILASCIILFPSFKYNDLKITLMIIFGFYTILKLTQFILIYKEKDYESLFTSIISLAGIIAVYFSKLNTKQLALILLLWMGLMCLTKLKKADFYHDRANKIWILRLFMLFIFLTNGLLTGMNLFYDTSIQIIVVGNFFFLNSVLDAIDPIVIYLKEVEK